MADWPLRGDGQLFENAGADPSASKGTDVTTSGSTHTKGSYTELIASTTFDAVGFCWYMHSDAGAESFLLDLAVGATGSEKAIVENFPLKVRAASEPGATQLLFSLAIPSGSRISVRGQATAGSEVMDTLIVLISASSLPSSPFGRCTSYGADLASSHGTTIIANGSAHVKGSWAEVTPSTLFDIQELGIIIGNDDDFSRTADRLLVDISIGGSGSEKILFPNILVQTSSGTDIAVPQNAVIPAHIPAGTRFAVRSQSNAGSTINQLDMILLGMG